MKKQSMLRILNVLLAVAFLSVSIAVLLYYWGPFDWRGHGVLYILHQVSGISFIVIAILHLILNWNWVLRAYFTKKKKR